MYDPPFAKTLCKYLYLLILLENISFAKPFHADEGVTEQALCPECIGCSILRAEQIGTFTEGNEVHNKQKEEDEEEEKIVIIGVDTDSYFIDVLTAQT